MTKDEEKGYIERVLAGDGSAYEPLVTENQTKVYRLALRILKNETDAEDAAQEAFLKAYTSLADFRGDSRFSVWLYRLTNNICIDMLRKNRRAVIVPLRTEDENGEEASFVHVLTFVYEGQKYVALEPVEQQDDEEAEVVLLKVDTKDGQDYYNTIDNEILLNEVFNEFLDIVEEMDGEDEEE